MAQIRDKMVEDMTLRGLAPNTQETYLRAVRAFVAFFMRTPAELGTGEVRAYLLFLLQVALRSPSTVNVTIGALRFLFGTTLERPEVMETIRSVRKDHPQPEVLAGSEVLALLEHAPSLRYLTLFTVLYSTGLRVSEALNLTPKDIDSRRMVISIHGTKNKYDRLVALTPKVLGVLRKYWIQYRPTGDFLFPGQSGLVPLSREAVLDAIKKAASAAGITKNVHPHSLRHAYATHSLELGTDLRTVQILLGHNSIKSTTQYTHLSEARRQTLRNPLDVLGTEEGPVLG